MTKKKAAEKKSAMSLTTDSKQTVPEERISTPSEAPSLAAVVTARSVAGMWKKKAIEATKERASTLGAPTDEDSRNSVPKTGLKMVIIIS